MKFIIIRAELGTSTICLAISDHKVANPVNVVLNNTVEDYINTAHTPVRTLTLSCLTRHQQLDTKYHAMNSQFPLCLHVIWQSSGLTESNKLESHLFALPGVNCQFLPYITFHV